MKTRRSGRADTQQRLLPLVAVRALGHRSRWGKFDEQAKPGKQADQHQVVEHEPQVEQHADRCEEDGGEYHLKWRDIALGPVAVLARADNESPDEGAEPVEHRRELAIPCPVQSGGEVRQRGERFGNLADNSELVDRTHPRERTDLVLGPTSALMGPNRDGVDASSGVGDGFP